MPRVLPFLKLDARKAIPRVGLSASPSAFASPRLDQIGLIKMVPKHKKGKGILNGAIPVWRIDKCDRPNGVKDIVENINIRCPHDRNNVRLD